MSEAEAPRRGQLQGRRVVTKALTRGTALHSEEIPGALNEDLKHQEGPCPARDCPLRRTSLASSLGHENLSWKLSINYPNSIRPPSAARPPTKSDQGDLIPSHKHRRLLWHLIAMPLVSAAPWQRVRELDPAPSGEWSGNRRLKRSRE